MSWPGTKLFLKPKDKVSTIRASLQFNCAAVWAASCEKHRFCPTHCVDCLPLR